MRLPGRGPLCPRGAHQDQNPHVVIDKDISGLKDVFPGEDILFIEGDPTREQTLVMANLEHARGLISALSTDSENLLVVLSARELNATIRLISCVFDRESARNSKGWAPTEPSWPIS